MRCPDLSELPFVEKGKTGWPWTEESRQLPERMPDGREWPLITIVTPSYNHGQFLEEAIRSVLLQGYPNLEYFLFDGGSTDNSIEIIHKYKKWFTYWTSERDSGQSAAINQGFKKGSGVFATWINSDDMFCKNALYEHCTKNYFDDDTFYVGVCLFINENGNYESTHTARVYSIKDLLNVKNVWRKGGNIVQPEVIFPRQKVINLGGLNEKNYYSMDFELWGMLLSSGIKIEYTNIKMAMSRRHKNQKTSDGWRTTVSLIDTAKKIAFESNVLNEKERIRIVNELELYKKTFWKNTGTLAKVGLKPRIVLPIRRLTKGMKRFIKIMVRYKYPSKAIRH